MAVDRATDFSGPVSTSMGTRHIAAEAAEGAPKIRPRDVHFPERRRKNRHSAEARPSPGGLIAAFPKDAFRRIGMTRLSPYTAFPKEWVRLDPAI